MREKVGIALLFSIILEISLGGGGRFTSFGAVTLRMLLFALSILYFLFAAKGNTVSKQYMTLTFVFFINLVFSTYIGLINNASIDNISEDIKSFSYFLIFPFLAETINSVNRVKLILKIIMTSSLIMSIGYLIIYYLLENKVIDFQTFYVLTEESGEIFFRNESAFFYKGFLFPCIGVFIFLQNKDIWSKIAALIMMFAVFMTYTRGFLISIIIILTASLLIKSIYKKRFVPLIVVALFFMSTASSFMSFYVDAVGSKEESDTIRITTMNEVFSKIDFLSFWIGHGLGIGVPTRPIHMEISFLEIFHKQGVVGLLFWMVIFVAISRKFIETCRIRRTKESLPLYLSSVFIYIQSQTNPFLTNPIGVCMIAVSMIGMDVICNSEKPLEKLKMSDKSIL